MKWESYIAEGSDYVPMRDWGKDHWSTFAYLVTRAVDGKGMIDNRRMRCSARLHRHFAHTGTAALGMEGSKSPTFLAGGALMEGHDDWSCLEDMVHAGLIKAEYREKYPDRTFGNMEARIELTELGLAYSALITQHKVTGNSFGNFRPPHP